MAADVHPRERTGVRLGWRSATWPRPTVVVAAVGLGLVCSVVTYLLGETILDPPRDAQGAGQILDRLAVAAMLPFVLLALPRRLPDVEGAPVGRPFVRTTAFAGAVGLVWFGLLTAVGHGELRFVSPGLALALPMIVVTVLQVTAEESLFRLLLPLTLVRLFGRSPHAAIAATAISTILFGLYHLPSTPAAFADHVLFGLLMHQALSATRTIRVPIILHALNNLFAQHFLLDASAPETVPHLLAAKYLILFAFAAALFPVRPVWPATAWPQRFATVPGARAGVARTGRLAAIDALRGFALLAIMLENLLVYLPAEAGSAATSPTDRGIRAVMAALLEYRGLPLFALLLGFGVHLLIRRAATAEDRAAILRRNASFIVIGTMHGLLVFPGDILAVYGLLLYGLVWAVRNPRRAHLVTWISGVLFALQTLVLPVTLAATVGGAAEPTGSMFALTLGEALTLRVTEWLLYVVSAPLLSSGLLFPMLIGFRTAALVVGGPTSQDSVRVARLLTVVLGLGSVVMCLPYAMVLWTGWGDAADIAAHPWELVSAQVGGLLGALAAWFTVIAIRARRPAFGWIGRLVTVIGTRSLTLYLLHSVALVVLLTPPLGGLATKVSYTMLESAAVLSWMLAGPLLSRPWVTRAGLAERLVRDMAANPAVDRRPASRPCSGVRAIASCPAARPSR
jgi:uncharacterized protein